MDAAEERDFVAFVEARSHALFRTALALTGHRQHAEDLLQTALAKAFRRWPQVRRESAEGYVRTTMYRQQVSWWRTLGHRREYATATIPEPAAHPAGGDPTAPIDLRLALWAALAQLAPKYRAVLVLRYLEDLPDDEIALILQCKPATVRSQSARGLSRLRDLCPELGHLAPKESLR